MHRGLVHTHNITILWRPQNHDKFMHPGLVHISFRSLFCLQQSRNSFFALRHGAQIYHDFCFGGSDAGDFDGDGDDDDDDDVVGDADDAN